MQILQEKETTKAKNNKEAFKINFLQHGFWNSYCNKN